MAQPHWSRRFERVRSHHVVAAASVGLLLVVLAGVTTAAGQSNPAPWHVVQGSDGTLYVLKDGSRYALQADPITDDDLQAFPDAGPLGPLLAPAVIVAPTPTATPMVTSVDTSGSAFSPTVVPFGAAVPTPLGGAAGSLTPYPSSGTPLPPGPMPGSSSRLPPSSAFAPPPSAPVAVSTPLASTEVPVVLTGTGSTTSRTFALHGGSYSVLWTAATVSTTDNFAAFLRPLDPSGHSQVITTVLVPGGRSVSGQAQVLNVAPGAYYVEVIGGSNWNLSVAAAPPGPA